MKRDATLLNSLRSNDVPSCVHRYSCATGAYLLEERTKGNPVIGGMFSRFQTGLSHNPPKVGSKL